MPLHRSICDLNDDIIGVILNFTPHIWNVLNFTATSRRFNTLSERHLKTLKTLDVRFPYREDSESARTIEKEIKEFCMRRCGSQLTEIKIFKPKRSDWDTEFIRSLQLLPHTLMKLIGDYDKLKGFQYQLFSNQDTIAKQRSIVIHVHQIVELAAVVDKSDHFVITGLRQDFSAVNRVGFDYMDQGDFEAHLVVKCCTLFPSLETLNIDFTFYADIELDPFIAELIFLLSETDDKIHLEIHDWVLLRFPGLIVGLKDHLPRLQVFWPLPTENPFNERTVHIRGYRQVEKYLKRLTHEKFREDFLQSISRLKRIKNKPTGAEQVIGFNGNYTETLHLQMLNIEPLQRKQLFRCIKNTCPNFRHVNLDFRNNSEDRILDFYETFGHSLETVTHFYHKEGSLSLEMLITILDYCPNLKSFRCNGIDSGEAENIASLYERFLKTRHLEFVELNTGCDPFAQLAFSIVYCNGKMAQTEHRRSCYMYTCF
ncbi:hypothetical protein HDE_12826 [Halotydeus destructor]|nr:hypothetical protein HDE_12826 [Halotydeus destructor]